MTDDLVFEVLKKADGNAEVLKRFLEEIKEGSKVKIISKYKFEVTGTLENKFYSAYNGQPEYIRLILENGL